LYVKVLGKDYKIVPKKDLMRDESKYATVNFVRQIIEIDSELIGNQNQHLEESLIHEIFHIILHAILSTKLLEDQINCTSEMFYQVLKDNPEFFKVKIAECFNNKKKGVKNVIGKKSKRKKSKNVDAGSSKT